MITFDSDKQKLTYAEQAMDALRCVIERQQKELADTMTPRDYFAVAALTGLISTGRYENTYDSAADAYHIADAMMKARAALGEGNNGQG